MLSLAKINDENICRKSIARSNILMQRLIGVAAAECTLLQDEAALDLFLLAGDSTNKVAVAVAVAVAVKQKIATRNKEKYLGILADLENDVGCEMVMLAGERLRA